eukprot:CAMPEP_0170413842 /NCGR_PEP_ID=MMETSP0117_2-20130122/31745_1 /TAXON_ID=400756 /ORGANISM="Durinskia baltica, Strain CSIRO CS-38" /LENGTH=39 /DNA_ID= /DNA_START= /DNA_END= /DNA_ORIENTATION=
MVRDPGARKLLRLRCGSRFDGLVGKAWPDKRDLAGREGR